MSPNRSIGRLQACPSEAKRGFAPHYNNSRINRILPKMLSIENQQMVSALAPDRANQRFDVYVLPRRSERCGSVSDAIAWTRALNATPNALSLSRMRYSARCPMETLE